MKKIILIILFCILLLELTGCSYYDTELINNEESQINQNVNVNIELDK